MHPTRLISSLALATLLALIGASPVEARSTRKKVRIRTMTFNIRYDFRNDGHNRWENRAETVAKVIAQSESHVVCLQEDKRHQVEDLERLLAGEKYGFIGRGRNATGSGERCSILYRTDFFRLKDCGDFWLSDTPDRPGSNTWGDKYPRKVTWALLSPKKSSKTKLLVLNAHFPEGNRGHIRNRGAALMQSWLAERLEGEKADEISVIVSGDFNTGEGTEPYTTLTETSSYSLNDAWTATNNRVCNSPGTFCGFKGLRTRERIDWILVGGPTRVSRVVKLDDQVDGRWPSDHYPIFADLELR